MQGSGQKAYDCVILGSGIGGSMLGAILARHGLDVLLLDSEAHPRFAIGEATTPDTNLRLKLLSVKYDLPEIGNLSAFEPLRDHVSPACGVKRAFSFLYHRDGQEQQPLESQQYPTLAPPMGADCHFFRQDTDAYMLAVALQYGARTITGRRWCLLSTAYGVVLRSLLENRRLALRRKRSLVARRVQGLERRLDGGGAVLKPQGEAP